MSRRYNERDLLAAYELGYKQASFVPRFGAAAMVPASQPLVGSLARTPAPMNMAASNFSPMNSPAPAFNPMPSAPTPAPTPTINKTTAAMTPAKPSFSTGAVGNINRAITPRF